jgi:hypothetical protein
VSILSERGLGFSADRLDYVSEMDPFVEDRATIDERTMLVERRNGPMFYVTINPTVDSTAKDYKSPSTVQQELSWLHE